MLKWAVYAKKNQEVKSDAESEEKEYDGPYNNKTRRSLDAQSIKKSKKPSRYQRRSLGPSAVKKNIKTVDKENLNYIGNTPNYFKEGFVKKTEILALKDVSNITPTNGTPVKHFERRRYYLNESNDDIPPKLPPTPPTYSRRVREAKKRKLEMSQEGFRRDSSVYKSERRIRTTDRSALSSGLSHSSSEPSLNELSDRLSLTSSRLSFAANKLPKNNGPISTTKATGEGIVEIEYDEDLVLNCIEKPVADKTIEKTTLPIFGHHIFTDNPLYFNKNDNGFSNIIPLKRTRKKSNEFESSFKSPCVDKRDAHTLVRDACSPVSITPLSMKLAALRFSALSTHSKSKRAPFTNDVTEFFPKIENQFPVTLKDEESATEMEYKFILGKDSVTNNTESTVSTTQMGDVTLERMIEDIIKSTKIIKSKRRVLNKDVQISIEEEIPPLECVKDLFVNPQAENKANLIKEARYVNLSRENSISPKSTPTKKIMPVHRVNEKLLKNLPIGCFILDDGDGYNEREVCTPENVAESKSRLRSDEHFSRSISRSQSMNAASTDKGCLNRANSESTPDISRENSLRLKRQRCIRRKKSTVSNDSQWKLKDSRSVLTHMEIPSPALDLHSVSTESFSLETFDEAQNKSTSSNVSHSSLMPFVEMRRSQEMFGLTIENGILSPITPVPNLKRPSNVLSEERAHKTSKLDLPNDAFTPVIEHKSSRRCLTYSPEDGSINSSEEKRRSVASNPMDNSGQRLNVPKGTIDLEIITRNDIIDVHVIRCRDLQRASGKTEDINAYAKVVIGGASENQSLPSQRSIFQRTSVLYGKREPEFQRHLKLPLPASMYDNQMLHISVWHRDKKYRRSEFLGCVSFPLKDAAKSDVAGSFFLQRPAPTPHACARELSKMATDNIDTSTEEKENCNDKGALNGPSGQTAVAAALQKEADEHLFLRYLELDPPEEASAPRRSQRNGRTPFTTSRKLSRGNSGGFGFTVVWTRPPRVERVAAGGSAERAGLRAGDYIVFVGNKNVVTSSEDEVRGLVKTAGQTLLLETFRRVPQNGVGARPRLAQVTIPFPESTPPPAPRSPRVVAPASPAPVARPPTACSSTSQSLDRRKLQLPQVTFSKEVGNGIIV